MSLLPRGVYCAPYLSLDGFPVLLAVDADHRLVAVREVGDGDDSLRVFDQMYATLDALDQPRPANQREGARLTG